jgi:hypothetical protein
MIEVFSSANMWTGMAEASVWLDWNGWIYCLYQKVWDYRPRVFRGVKHIPVSIQDTSPVREPRCSDMERLS